MQDCKTPDLNSKVSGDSIM